MPNRFSWLLTILLIVQYAFSDQGGVDSFGHMWTDSGGTTNVEYEWLDVKSSSSAVFGPGGFDDEAPVQRDLPFSFSFYGVNHTSIYISPNGWLSFKAPADAAASNDTLPSASALT